MVLSVFGVICWLIGVPLLFAHLIIADRRRLRRDRLLEQDRKEEHTTRDAKLLFRRRSSAAKWGRTLLAKAQRQVFRGHQQRHKASGALIMCIKF